MSILDDYDYDLPEHLIAQYPARERDGSRLLVLGDAVMEHLDFRDLPRFLDPGDLLVVNDTRVFPARLIGRKRETGGEVEIFLLHPVGDGSWEALSRPARRIREGTVVEFGDGALRAVVEGRGAGGHLIVRLESECDVNETVDRLGKIPLPHYIRREPESGDLERYQTVYARHRGAAAAPTAGLHFTGGMLERLVDNGVRMVTVTLHVGIGTFRPLTEETAAGDRLHSEFCRVSRETVDVVRETRAGKGRVIAVGTTSVRALESASMTGTLEPFEGWTDLFIRDNHIFRSVDALITNFHLPRSSLLMLVCAFAGRERVLDAYKAAIRENYRFFSYGDAMFITGKGTSS